MPLTSIIGAITIHPPIGIAELRDIGDGRLPYLGPALDLHIINAHATEIVPLCEGDKVAVEDPIDLLQRVINTITTTDRTFTGYLQFHGDDHADAYRLYIRHGTVVRVDPVITWTPPDT